MKCKNLQVKQEYHLKCKNYSNLVSTLLKDSKQKYFNNLIMVPCMVDIAPFDHPKEEPQLLF